MTNRTVKLQEIRLEDIDQSIKDWLDLTVDSFVDFPNGERKKVPVIFSSGERAITSRQKKGIRDSNGVLILPLISVRRTGVNPQPNMQALGIETPTLQVARRISPKTNDLRNLETLKSPSLQSSIAPVVYEVTTIPFPDRNILTYELLIQAQYITQMNTITEKMFHELDLQKSFLAPFENDGRHPPLGEAFEDRKPLKSGYVVGFFDSNASDTGNFEEFTDQERIVRYSTTFTVPATLQLDPEGERPSARTETTAYNVRFGDEKTVFVDDPLELELIFGRDRITEKK